MTMHELRELSESQPHAPSTHDVKGALVEPLQLSFELRDFTRFPIAPVLAAGKPKLYEQCLQTMQKTREYAEKHVWGRTEALDQQAKQDHQLVPWAAIDAALPYGFLSQNVPEVFGGKGMGPLSACVFAEELAAADAGVYVIYGAHALALSALIGTLDTGVLNRVGQEMAEGERNGKAVMLALAHTEPGGGSDVEDVDEIKHARYASKFTRVPGGYRINSRKVFISNGSIARYNVLTASEDVKRPFETLGIFLIPNDAPGFSVGRLEHKMGQRLSTAVEVICEDVFVPDANATSVGDGARVIDSALSLSRGPVGGMGTGIIRGVLERTLRYLSQKRVSGHWLFEEQWVQLILADMVACLQAGRGLYMDAGLASESWGVAALMGYIPTRPPDALQRSGVYGAMMAHPSMTQGFQRLYASQVPIPQLQRLVSHASIAKFMCTDMAVRMSMKAMEILGEDASDPQWGIEKCMRDAKLGQIFEGTNQVNRLHVARGVVKRA